MHAKGVGFVRLTCAKGKKEFLEDELCPDFVSYDDFLLDDCV